MVNLREREISATIYLQEVLPAARAPEEAIAPEIWQLWLQSWLAVLSDYLPAAASYELSLRLTDDREIQALNAQYRHQDKPTDVLAFASLEVEIPQSAAGEDTLEPLYLGDIVISQETAARQAREQGWHLKVELAWLAAHGLLHLLGWDHPEAASLSAMIQQQEILLKKVDLLL